jgi:outer membrane protein assembly factor BamA
MKAFFLPLLFCVTFLKGNAQADSTGKPVYSVLPFAFFLPETDVGFGVGGIMSFRFKGESPGTAASQLQLGASYTLNNQWLFYLPWRLFWEQERNLSYGELGYYLYVYPYYGMGINSKKEDEEYYDVIYPRVRISMLRELRPHLYVGVRYWFDNFNITGFEPESSLQNSGVTGVAGGELGGLGLVSNYDSRDNQFYPSRGWFVETVVLPHTAAFNSDFDFLKLSLDASRYQAIGEKQVVAVNAFWESNIGEAPFFNMAFVGGAKRLRGYIDGRFRDHNASVLQAEYRWKFYKRFGLTLFYGMGNVFEDFSSLSLAATKHAFGGGLRFQLSKRELVNLRIDAGYAPTEGANFYITFGEAF